MRGVLLCLVPLVASGCFLDRAALGEEVDAAQPGLDAAVRDAGRDGFVPPRDVGPGDAGDCTPTAGGVEICDGLDNDCTPSTPDGVDDPMRGQACDGDGDDCVEGVLACEGGGLVCVDDSVDPPELCNGVDDDCDPSTLDGSGDPALGAACDGSDADACEEGVTICMGGAMACDDETRDMAESCNRMDDDCDGLIDEEPGCTCRGYAFGGHTYLFCNETVTDWSAARAACPAGYDLAIVTTVEEQTFVGETADSIDNGNFWLGATRDMPPSPDGTTFTWLDGTPVPLSTGSGGGFQNWDTDQPDTATEDCLEMDADRDSPAGVRGRWNDRGCDSDNRYVCESL